MADPKKDELLSSLTIDQLKDLADANGYQFKNSPTVKDDYVAELTSTTSVSKEDVQAYVDATNESGTTPGTGSTVASTTTAPVIGPDAMDPALVDPEAMAREGKEGSTSDPAMRLADERHADTPPDQLPGPKQTDAGAEAYPFPASGDVEVALVDPGNSKEETPRVLQVDDRVRLGEHELVPPRLVGRVAMVTQPQREDGYTTVRTRDEVQATLTLPREAFETVETGAPGALSAAR